MAADPAVPPQPHQTTSWGAGCQGNSSKENNSAFLSPDAHLKDWTPRNASKAQA
jgi:hypothetical protein